MIIFVNFRFKSYIGGRTQAVINLGNKLSDGKWHSVYVLRKGKQTDLKVDKLHEVDLTAGSPKRLHLDEYFYIGGLGNNTKRYFPRTDISTFTGCLSNVQLNDIKLLEGAQQKTLNFIVSGDIVFQCGLEDYSPVTFISPLSYVKFVLQQSRNDQINTLVISFKFRTYVEDGLIISRRAVKVKMYLKLKQSSLHLDIIATNSRTLLKIGKNLANGNWYKVVANISGSLVSLQLNNEFARANLTNVNKGIIRKFCAVKLYVGRDEDKRTHSGFVGCLLNLQVNTHNIKPSQFIQGKYQGVVIDRPCEIKNRCFPNNCQNEGKCQQTDDVSFSCDCSGIEYDGPRCEISIYKRTCSEYRAIGLVNDSRCLIRSRSSGTVTRRSPFTALCKLATKERTITIVEHKNMKETGIQLQTANVIHNLSSHTIHYPASPEQLKDLIDDSLNCRQHVRFDCHRLVQI